ncbi:MAG: patatin-like phospholipase family protein, partial [Ignavibacteriaceae bacterium]
ILSGEILIPQSNEIKELIKELKGELEFGLARKILLKAVEIDSKNIWLQQQLALCTYKDEELLPVKRFDGALKILDEIGLSNHNIIFAGEKIDPKTLPETLALGGAVYKRKWEHGGQIEYLNLARAFYYSAWERDPKIDMGYGGVNAAYIIDILTMRAKETAIRIGMNPDDSAEVKELQSQAFELRNELVAKLPEFARQIAIESNQKRDLKKEFYYNVTLAQVHFGLMNYNEAAKFLEIAATLNAKEWELHSTFKQLVSIARMQGILPPTDNSDINEWHEAWQALKKFLGDDTKSALSCFRGKVGLALSGGGFRASLFHLGVLARLAEMDVLRSLEILSTVSGGSIVGAHYYLEVQDLLVKMTDKDITREDYIEIVRRLQKRFLTGVQRNLRTRALSNLWKNFRMIFSKEYSRSHRLGELYEKEIYVKIGKSSQRRITPRTMPELLVTPANHSPDKPFKPKFQNWRRFSKVPILLLNTTSLNSGHSWHFTARWMGEPPGSVSTEVDINDRYRRLWYEQAPKAAHKNFRLGYAVAASACVPGLFEPLVLDGLFPGRTVKLVDGGVHDNQGVEALLDEGCTLVLCSDASGQMQDIKRPSSSILGVPQRTNSILMDRVREAQYQDLRTRVDSRSLQGLFFVHLKKDLDTLPIDWTDCDNPTVPPLQSFSTTEYGIDKELQRKLAGIRTDLDSFTEIEAYSLMLSGYLMTEHEFKKLDKEHKKVKKNESWGDFNVNAPREEWEFLKLENIMRLPDGSSDARREEIEKQLDVSSSLAFKAWKLIPFLNYLSWILGLAVVSGLVWWLYNIWDEKIVFAPLSIGRSVIFVLLLIAGITVPILKWLQPQRAFRSYILKIVLAILGWIVAWIHLLIFDPLFIKRGSLKKLLKLE